MELFGLQRWFCKNFATRVCEKYAREDHSRRYCYTCSYRNLITDVECGACIHLYMYNGIPKCTKSGNGCGVKPIRSNPCLKHDWKEE
ncbi:hypothetical protein AGMMS49992_33630 [Clostridia bacterium]|nr:hypothetical protein AGMMS49992_33630 [Clostridia bacterium]